jgi:preprotein translocase subunit SecB
MDIAPIQLVDYFVHSIHVEALPSYDSSKPPELDITALKVTKAVFRADDASERSFGLELTIKQDAVEEKNLPYAYELRMVGFIEVLPKNLSENKMRRMVEINGPSMLFGAAREILRAATGRGPYGHVLIPSTTFYTPPEVPKAKKKVAAKRALKGKK